MLEEFIKVDKKKIEDDKKIRDDLEKIKHVCKCGHPVYFSNRYDFTYCTVCWRRVYRDEATEFKHKLLQASGQVSNDKETFSNARKRS